MLRAFRWLMTCGLVYFAAMSDVLALSPQVRVVVDTGEEGDDEDAQRVAVRERVVDQLRALSFDVGRSGETELRVELYWDDVGQTRQAVTVTVNRADQQLARSEAVCESCGTDELLAEVAAGVEAVEGKLRRATTSGPNPAVGATSGASGEPAADPQAPGGPQGASPATAEAGPQRALDDGQAPPERSAMRVLGWTGVGVVGVGVAGVAVGAWQWSKGEVIEPGPNSGVLLATDFRPLGITLVGIGGAAVVAGAVMIAVDVTRRRRVVAAAPLLGPSYAGLAVAGRF